MPRIGSVPPSNGVGGNYNVLDATHTFNTPNNTNFKVGRIRIIYRNAWSEVLSPDLTVKEGIVFDFNIKIINPTTGTKQSKLSVEVRRSTNRLQINNLNGNNFISVLDVSGKVIYQRSTTEQNVSIKIPSNCIILKIQNEAGNVYLKKM